MTKRFSWVMGVALCCFGLSTAYYASDKPNLGQACGSPPDYSAYNHRYSDATLAKVIPGKTTKAEVEKLLGQPWRTTNFAKIGEAEPDHEEPEVWEWRGRDSQNGLYRVHIEFNPQGIVTNVAKIAEKTGTAPARVVPSTQVSPPTARPSVTDNPSAGMFRYQAPVPQTLNRGDSPLY